MKILVLGAKGNLGSQLVKVFGGSHDVRAWDREDIDLLNFDEAGSKILALQPELIINSVAYNAVDKCEVDDEQFELAKKLNGEAVAMLADIALELEAILIHYVSDYVFKGESKEGYGEDDKPEPVSRYGQTKLTGEEAVKSRAEKGLKFYLIRTSKLFGPAGTSELAKPSFFDIMLKLGKEKGELNIVDAEVSCFTYTVDLAEATLSLVEDKKEYGIYHIINPGAVTWYEGACELFKLAGVDVKVNPVSSDAFPRPAKRPQFAELVNTKLPPLRNYREALREYLSLIGS